MFEILGIIWFTRHLSRVAKQKGHSGWWGAVGATGWIMGELIAGCMGGLAGLEGMAFYPLSILGALIGAGIGFAIVSALPVADGYDPLANLGGSLSTAGGTACPSCGSMQTEAAAGLLQCNACGEIHQISPWDSPRS